MISLHENFVISGNLSIFPAGSSDESLDSAGGEGSGHTFMLVERLTCDKHVIRILPFAHKVDPTLLPMCVLMECSMFLVGFQMLAMLTREGEVSWSNFLRASEKFWQLTDYFFPFEKVVSIIYSVFDYAQPLVLLYCVGF